MVGGDRIMLTTTFEYGKIPPQAIEIEEAILGAALLEKDATITAIQLVRSEMFYLVAHQIIFDAIFALFNEGKGVDMLSVTIKLKAMGKLESVGGVYYISQLTGRIASGSRTGEFCLILMERWMRRRLIELSSKAIQQAYDDTCDINSDIDTFSIDILKLKEGISQDISINEISNQNMTQIRKVKSGEIERYGISTKLNDLDNVINGLIAPDLIILAGRPGMGKSALALTVIKNVAITQKIPVGIFSLEMGAEQLEIRLKSMISGVSASRALRGNISEKELYALEIATKVIESSPIYINDRSSLKLSDVRSKAIEWRASYGIKLIVLDYIQLMSGNKIKGQTRDQEIGIISGGLKRLAKEIEVPIIALSQLNRDVERRNPPEPRLSDLRESGSLEADADIVLMLYRPEYYDIKEVSFKGETISTDNLCFLGIEKHRNGATGTIAFNYNLAISYFYDYGVKQNYDADKWIEKEDNFLEDNYVSIFPTKNEISINPPKLTVNEETDNELPF